MKTSGTRLRTLAATGAVAAATLLGANPAQAHDELLATNPADGSTLAQAPAELELTYSGDIMDVDGANQVRVTNAAGDSVTSGDPEIDGTAIRQPLSTSAAEGTYTVTWRVVSSDGHPIQGTFTYTVGDASAATASAEPSAENTDSASTSSADTDPVSQATGGLPMPLKIVLVLVAVAALGSVLTVVLKNRGAK
ncbi:copper resistance CopC family protein [Rothia nasisuis]|uniref:copper resistance CopC family protein n=1 Tax=Rothia nasisuis TaxID=2109647 RepID=UPI001F2F8DB1|nr:copper resistance CopC family protein [Rothia nasisuis]